MGSAGFDYQNKKFSAIAGRTTAALVGGTVSELTGGKFGNGARTAAMAHLFNAESRTLSKAFQGQSICKGSCHGYDGTVGQPLTKEQEALLESGAAIIITLPVSGGAALLATTGKVIELSYQSHSMARAIAATSQARAIHLARQTQLLATDVAAATFTTAAPVVSNPTLLQNSLEFIEGYFVNGPPPPTPAGVAGYTASELMSE